MNVQLLREVREQILRTPQQFFMGDWHTSIDRNYGELGELCGTTCCIGGWAGVLGGVVKKRAVAVEDVDALTAKGRRFAAKVDGAVTPETINEHKLYQQMLGLDDEQATRLFYQHSWPNRFKADYATAPLGSKERARIAAKRITHFLKTKGAE